MKKISLICAGLLLCGALSTCSTQSSKQASKSNAEESSLKAENSSLKKKVNKGKNKKKQSQSSSTSSNSGNNKSNSKNSSSHQQANSSQTSASNSSSRQVDKADPSTWDDIPYKGYPSYNAYLEANSGDPEIQAETARMQHDENVRKGIENPDGSETQNFKNWVSQRDQAWDNGQDMPEYDQNTTY